MRDLPLANMERALPPSPREIVAIRVAARMSQSVFARLLDVSTGTLSKWERGEIKPRGPAGRLLHVIKHKGIDAIL
jgi:putative transcriptional regulator